MRVLIIMLCLGGSVSAQEVEPPPTGQTVVVYGPTTRSNKTLVRLNKEKRNFGKLGSDNQIALLKFLWHPTSGTIIEMAFKKVYFPVTMGIEDHLHYLYLGEPTGSSTVNN